MNLNLFPLFRVIFLLAMLFIKQGFTQDHQQLPMDNDSQKNQLVDSTMAKGLHDASVGMTISDASVGEMTVGEMEHSSDPIVITATLSESKVSDAPIQTIVISAEQIEEQGATTVTEAIQNETGLIVTPVIGSTGQSVRLQGLESRYLVLLIDGMPVIHGVNDEVNLDQFPVASIERIEIVKGPSSSLYGNDAVAGVINIITKKGKGKGFSLNLSSQYGLHNQSYSQLMLSQQLTNLWFRLDTTFAHSDAFDFIGNPSISDFDEFNSFSSFFRMGFTPDKVQSWTLFANYYGNWSINNKYLLQENIPSSHFEWLFTTQRYFAGIENHLQLNNSHHLNFKAYWNNFNHFSTLRKSKTGDLADPVLSDENRGQFEAMYQWVMTSQQLLTGILGLSYENITTPRTNGLRERATLYFAAQDEWYLSPQATLIGGFRMDFNSIYGFNFNPKLSFSIKFAPTWLTMRASVGSAFKAPNFRNLFIDFRNPTAGYTVVGNPQLKPESSWGANLGIDIFQKRLFNLNLNYFINYLENQISAVLISGQDFTYDNLLLAYTTGIEALLTIKVLKNLPVQIGYTYTYGNYRAEDQMWYEQSLLPLHQLHFNVKYEIKDATWGFRAAVFGELFSEQVINTPSELLEPYLNLHIRIEQTILKNLLLFAGVDNLLNYRIAYPYLPGIHFYSGFSTKL